MISKEQFLTIKRLKQEGVPIAAIARRIGISEPTTRKWANMSEAGFDELKMDDIPYLDNYREFILSILRVCPQTRETNILYRLREEFPDFECRKTTFYKYMRKLREQTGFVQFTGRVTSLRDESPPGYEAQVDFGQYRMKDMYGKSVRVYFFCMVLAYSRMHYVYFSRDPFTTKTAIQAHEYAFQYFGGRTQMIVYDQDRVFVVDENFGNIVLVPKFEEYVKKVGFSVRLCRPHDPQSKGKVETFVRYIKESFLAGRIYKGIDSLNSDALRWLDAEGNGTTNLRTRKPPRVMFREEAQHLTRVPFSDEGFSEIRSVSDKYTVKIDWSVYELPRTAVKPFEQVRVEEQDGMLLFYKAAENELIHKCPRRESPGGTTAFEGNNSKGDSVASNSFRLRFEAYDVAEAFANKVEETEPRYKNLQLGRMLTLSNVFTMEQMVEAMDYCVNIGICSAAEVTAYLIYRHGKDYVTKRISKNAYYRNRERAEEIRREQDGRYR